MDRHTRSTKQGSAFSSSTKRELTLKNMLPEPQHSEELNLTMALQLVTPLMPPRAGCSAPGFPSLTSHQQRALRRQAVTDWHNSPKSPMRNSEQEAHDLRRFPLNISTEKQKTDYVRSQTPRIGPQFRGRGLPKTHKELGLISCTIAN